MMLFLGSALLSLSLLTAGLAAASPQAKAHAEIPTSSAYQTLQALSESALETALDRLPSPGHAKKGACTIDNVRYRRSWEAFTRPERRQYIKAVQCLQSKKPRTPSELASGVKSRYDDFVATHMNQTKTIHLTANFLSWHRYFIWLYEKALQDECEYQGTIPYWDWPLSAIQGLEASALFDGSDTSLSGNGAYIPDKGDIITGGVTLPSGTGGGCVTSGPFKDMVVNLGPVSLIVPGNKTEENPHHDTGIFSWNPRCLKRDLTDKIIRKYNGAKQVLHVITHYHTIHDFQYSLAGINLTTGANYLGVHGGGHFAIGGDPARDLFSSPGDPAFFAHHAMIDRVWWLWQMQAPGARAAAGPDAIADTRTFLNDPPSAPGTLDDFNRYGFAAAPPHRIRALLSTTAGPFCYVYE